MTTTTPNPATETPKRGVAAGAIALGAHALVVLAAFVAVRIVGPVSEGFGDIAAAILTLFGGEIVVTLACVIVGALVFRRGRQYTALGLMAGWLIGFLGVMAWLFL
ncbi:MAG: hypothetical protein IRY85_07710 [Micromonosporaceae bacterium]|nr:hypothetical protein [Micromonosporaceae bacterium]